MSVPKWSRLSSPVLLQVSSTQRLIRKLRTAAQRHIVPTGCGTRFMADPVAQIETDRLAAVTAIVQHF
jgi:hypothetical protein